MNTEVVVIVRVLYVRDILLPNAAILGTMRADRKLHLSEIEIPGKT